MPGRRLIPEEELIRSGDTYWKHIQRRTILRETLQAFERTEEGHYHAIARANLARWHRNPTATAEGEIRVIKGDWGVVTGELTRAHGEYFAVLNMANAYLPGGRYIEGTSAQEENMFRRTDCHFSVNETQIDTSTDRYHPEMTDLLSALDGRVYLDTDHPRICLRGPEDPSQRDLGYAWLPEDEIFPFFELRAAAQNAKRVTFDEDNARARIEAQFATLRDAGLRYVVLSAFGCGAFKNPPEIVARIYKDVAARHRNAFRLIAFAIFSPGYGPDNYTVFRDIFAG